MDTFELARRECVILDRDGQAPDSRVQRGPFGHCPRTQDLAHLDPHIEMQCRGVMQLYHEPRRCHVRTVQPLVLTSPVRRSTVPARRPGAGSAG